MSNENQEPERFPLTEMDPDEWWRYLRSLPAEVRRREIKTVAQLVQGAMTVLGDPVYDPEMLHRILGVLVHRLGDRVVVPQDAREEMGPGILFAIEQDDVNHTVILSIVKEPQ